MMVGAQAALREQVINRALRHKGSEIPVLIGGKLNHVAESSNTDLPVDVSEEIRATGAVPCADLDDMIPVLRRLAKQQY